MKNLSLIEDGALKGVIEIIQKNMIYDDISKRFVVNSFTIDAMVAFYFAAAANKLLDKKGA
jgi:hypothetical protein